MLTRAERDTWVAALRSGEYRQGIGYLRRDDNTYCCQGVLLDVLRPGHGMWLVPSGGLSVCSYTYVYGADQRETMTIPVSIAEPWDLVEIRDHLEHMNDGTGQTPRHTFAAIADWIEANVPVQEEGGS